jgi:hypothetical protein
MAAVTGAPAAPVPAHRTTRDARLPRSNRDVTAVPVGRSPTILELLKLLGSSGIVEVEVLGPSYLRLTNHQRDIDKTVRDVVFTT